MLQVPLHKSLLFSLVKEKVLAEAIDNLGSECKSVLPQGKFHCHAPGALSAKKRDIPACTHNKDRTIFWC